MKSLIIAEKPSVARDIARVLKCQKKNSGMIEGNQYVITWGLGHLVTLADPEQYDKKYKEWNMEHLPMMPEHLKTEVIKQTAKQYQTVKTQIHRKDVADIIIATDAGREGELVARLILDKAKNTKPIRRLWISSVTDKAIRDGFAHLKDGRAYNNLYDAAMCRAEADWLVGINATRALTCKYNAQLSCGRVQTPTLAMIYKREQEIRNFKAEPFYGMTATAGGVVFTWKDKKSGSLRSFQKERIVTLEKQLKNRPLQIVKMDRKKKKTYAKGLYDLTELQRDANQRFGFSAKETLNIMQRLYENHKVLTYPRTDSKYLTSDMVGTIKERLEATRTGPYKQIAAKLLRTKIEAKPSFVNDAKVTDHHAIIPTEEPAVLEHMSNEERKIYDLVVKRFFAVLYPPFEYEQTTLTAVIGEETFTASGKIVLKEGFREVYDTADDRADDEEENTERPKDQNLPLMKEGQAYEPVSLRFTEGKTKPPAYFNEGTLLAAMENPVKYMDSKDQKLAKTLGETGGLGTVATRADIIEKLFKTFYIEKQDQNIRTTSKAKQLLELVPEDLKQPELTAQWETKLSCIAKGQLKRQSFMREIRDYTVALVGEIKTTDGTFRHDNLTNKKCPECGKRLLSVNGKKSKMLVCQDRSCGYRETLAVQSNARCPKCHKKMEMIGKGEDKTFICRCGYKERLSKFQERRQKEGAGVSKRDVNNYLKKQQQEANEPLNNAFADAFKNLKL